MIKQIFNSVSRSKFNYFYKKQVVQLNPIKTKLGKSVGFTLIELLVVISIIGFLAAASVIIFNTVRMNARDAVRVANIAALSRALSMYFSDSGGYPASSGECLNKSSGVVTNLRTKQVLMDTVEDPLWSAVIPAHTNGIVSPGQTNFCYFYYSAYNNQYIISFFLESNSKSGNAGINTSIVAP